MRMKFVFQFQFLKINNMIADPDEIALKDSPIQQKTESTK